MSAPRSACPPPSNLAGNSAPASAAIENPTPIDPSRLLHDARRFRAVAVVLASTAERLLHAALEVNALGPEWGPSVVAWNREANDLLERSLTFRRDALELEALARRCVL